MNKKQISIMLVSIVTIIIFWFLSLMIADANEIERCKKQIYENNYKIEQIEKIKTQLHITAELIREENSVNKEFDLLLAEKWHEYNDKQKRLETENNELANQVIKEESKRKFIGNFKITHYCPCSTCNGSWGNTTAIGTSLTPYKTIAVDSTIIPLGSKVEIQDKIYIAEDTGGAIKGNRIDICVASHSEAYQKGALKNVPVYLINE